MIGLSGCAAGAGSNPLIGAWTLAQPNPPVEGQSTKDCAYTRWEFTPNHYEAFVGKKTGGPEMTKYVIEGKSVFATGAFNNISFTFVTQNQMFWSAAYGRCFYTRAQ
jgi:hypothetical protein